MDEIGEVMVTMAVEGGHRGGLDRNRLEMGWASWVQAAYDQSRSVSYA